MPWSNSEYPVSMKNLRKEVREKAVEIANALLSENEMEEGIAIATAISRAKDWAENRGKEFKNVGVSRSTDVKKHGEDRYVIPYEGNRWAIKKEGNEKVEKIYDTKRDAVSEARKRARSANASLTIQKKTGKCRNGFHIILTGGQENNIINI